ncbi:MAG: hypothetical protein AB8E74_10450 [Prochlorococcus sp.]
MSSGLEDAICLATAIDKNNTDGRKALQEYEQIRRPVVHSDQSMSRQEYSSPFV